MPFSSFSSKTHFPRIGLLVPAFFLLFFLGLSLAQAQSYLPEDSLKYLGSLKSFVNPEATGEELALAFIKNAILIVRYLVGAVALLLGAIYALQLVFSRGNEEAIEKQKTNFLWAFVGFIALIISENVAQIFNPEKATAAQLIDFGAARDQLRNIVDYLKWIVGSIIVLFMTITGVRMILSANEEEELTKHKQSLVWGLLGILVVLLASNIVNAIYVINAPDQVVAGGPESTITQVAGVLRLILVFLGPLAIAFTLYAGGLYLTAMDQEDQAERAKKMIIGGITGIVIIYGAFAWVNTLITPSLS